MSDYRNVNAYSAASGSRNVISTVRSRTRVMRAQELVPVAVPPHAVAVLVDVNATRAAWSAVGWHAEGIGSRTPRDSTRMRIARVEPVGTPP
jgi:hypothetical protein